ncbi:MAG: TylF/MycF/NovP-related O-methyltransferase [Planctomycetota bacterium]
MSDTTENFSMHYQSARTSSDQSYAQRMNDYFDKSLGTSMDKLRHFAKFVPRQEQSIYLAKHEIFRQALSVHGAIVECGVFLGGGLMTWANFSAIYEPFNHTRRVVGFDTFSGFSGLTGEDEGSESVDFKKEGGLSTGAEADIREALELYDLNRPIGHIPRAELVVGDATETIAHYVAENPQLVVAMLYLDFDAYAPTKAALEHLVPRMPKGAVICFDELYDKNWPGETQAVDEVVGLKNLRIERFPFVSNLSYAVL